MWLWDHHLAAFGNNTIKMSEEQEKLLRYEM